MKVEELKTKIKVTFPDECEIFVVEKAKEKLLKSLDNEKLIEIDLTKIKSIDTTFVQLILSYLKTLKNEEKKYNIKGISEKAIQVFELYGINLND
ncbi:STAS domain-containing protein [Deferribacter abyssi]|uniref:STAS domain-containing protein n=1 Tax=Deferribacter abyssi TaxID=213806 RepID=UPI003C24C851